MSKKEDLMTPEERAKKHGNEIMGVGIIYLALLIFIFTQRASILLNNTISMIIAALQVLLLIFMIIGGGLKNKLGVISALVFEIYLIFASIFSLVVNQTGPDLVGLIVMIFLPFEIKGLSKALKDMNNGANQ